jgi:hypothetical protein
VVAFYTRVEKDNGCYYNKDNGTKRTRFLFLFLSLSSASMTLWAEATIVMVMMVEKATDKNLPFVCYPLMVMRVA